MNLRLYLSVSDVIEGMREEGESKISLHYLRGLGAFLYSLFASEVV